MTTDADLYAFAERLFPLPRTVQGPGVLQTFGALLDWGVPLELTGVPVGTEVFDWTVLPDAQNRRAYHPTLDDVPAYDGPLTYAEAVIPGESPQEVLLSTYTCHPQMANDNVSGMVVTAALVRWLASAPRRYSYRALFAPETIGALCWLDKNLVGLYRYENFKRVECRIIAGYTIHNCGDERAWSFVPSRKGDTLADRAARHVLHRIKNPTPRKWGPPSQQPRVRTLAMEYDTSPLTLYPFSERGSDERQFCAPGVDLPVASVMRSKHGTYPEYHTPDDRPGTVVTAKGLGDSFRCYQRIIETIEANRTYRITTIGEPRLDKHGLYPTSGGPDETAKIARDLCAYSDGETDLIAMAEATGRAVWEIAPVAAKLASAGVLRAC